LGLQMQLLRTPLGSPYTAVLFVESLPRRNRISPCVTLYESSRTHLVTYPSIGVVFARAVEGFRVTTGSGRTKRIIVTGIGTNR